MAILSLSQVRLSFGGQALLDGVNLQIEAGDRLGLLGRNGAGKSTLLKLLQGSLAPDAGDVARQPGLRVAALPQDVPLDLTGPVRDYLQRTPGAAALTQDAAWALDARIQLAARDLELDLDAEFGTLSAGSKRRVLLAAALVQEAELLLLDEPTNHLDIDAIRHLEDTLLRRRGSLIFVTHDRSFLRRLATRILDLDRGRLRSYRAGYDAYLVQREEEQRVEAEQAVLFDKRLAQEEAWLRRGIKARRTRNEGRVRALKALRSERAARRDEVGRVKAQLQSAEQSGRIVLRYADLGYGFVSDKPIVRGLTGDIQRGDRIGILGPNGCGKTTLIGLLLGQIEPQTGTVTAGTRLEIAHFEQLHDVLDEGKSVFDNIADGRETVTVGGASRHVTGYLQDFLFTPEQIHGPITMLSGGERRRLQLARILARPCNLLVLDEPTNDLDLETLELLEDLLLDFPGTLLVVSHDRTFLDNVVTSTLVWEGDGRWGEYVGGYEDWLRRREAQAPPPPTRASEPKPARTTDRQRRLSFKERQELAALPDEIERLEQAKQAFVDLMASPDFYTTRGTEVAATTEQLVITEEALRLAFERWVELETLVGEGGE
jgi:ATP-binding cassette subfamily F protein uup